MVTAPPPPPPWPILVLSLTDAAGRRRAIAAQLEALGLGFIFFDAIDGRQGLAPEHEVAIDRPGTAARFGRPLSDGEYACALSHLAISRHILDAGLPGAVVLEDDAILDPRFAEFLRAGAQGAADLIQLDHLDARVWRFDRRRRLLPGVRLARLAANASLTTGYAISRRAAAHLAAHALPLRGPADWPCDMTVLGAAITLPRLVDHPPEEASTLQAQRARLVAARPAERRALRFFRRSYWRRWLFKRLTRKVS